MDHDFLFKELISTCSFEAIDLLLPEISAHIDHDVAVIPLDKEVFADVTLKDKRQADLALRVKFRGQDSFFLIHVEHQSKSESDFQHRMLLYFALLTKKYKIPVYPVVIFSYDTPIKREPKLFQVVFPGKNVLRFEYTVIQLNKIPWRRFLKTPNPVACALMTKMKIAVKERPRVRAECLRMLTTLKLDSERTKIISVFIDSYRPLNGRRDETV